MNQIILFFIRLEGWLYFIAIIISIISLFNLLRSRREWKLAIFSLEQEIARRKIRNAATWLILSVVFILAEFSFVIFASVKYPNIQLPTPTVSLQATPTLALLSGSELQTVNPGSAPTSSVLLSEGCTIGQIEWSSPKPGDQVRGLVDLKGTVNVSNLGYYKLEFRQINSTIWVTISGSDKPVLNDVLGGKWNASDLIPGDYQLRISVLDNQNVAYPDCTLTVHVLAP